MKISKLKESLVHGVFPKKDAMDIIFELFDNKINYHRLKNLSHYERFGKKDINNEKRIKELIKSRNSIIKYIMSIRSKEAKIKIYADIKVEIVS
ncbi:MAG: hypothetical protein AB7O73_11235 [Bacteroidia bacterium]